MNTRRIFVTGFLSALVAILGSTAIVETPSCTPASRATVLTAEQDACQLLVLGSSVIPIGTDPAVVAADVRLACDIVETATGYVEQVVAAYMGGQAEAGTAPPAAAGPYLPSARVLARRGIVVVERDGGVRR